MDFLLLAFYCLVIYVIVQFIRFMRADTDFTLFWAGMAVWITGASSGIGEGPSIQLAKTGASLVLSAYERGRTTKNHSKLQEKDILVLLLDLNEKGSHEAATKNVIQHFGEIDILVNNGGRFQLSLFLEPNLAVYEAIMQLNCLRQIITVSSMAGLASVPVSTGYAASKHALQVTDLIRGHLRFFNSLRPELKNAFTEEINQVQFLQDPNLLYFLGIYLFIYYLQI
uniref:Dehydrogenase/reductase (SDR family) member 7 n=1 Tax=Callorhinchus milii TaxID=7868 RepID=A0A4W3GSI5_CALMI